MRDFSVRSKIRLSLLLFAVFILYLFRLGNRTVPQTSWESHQKGSEIILTFERETELSEISYYLGKYENRQMNLETGQGNPIRWETSENVFMEKVYQWGSVPIAQSVQAIKLTARNVYTDIKELVILDSKGQKIRPLNAEMYPALFDEQDLYTKASYHSGTVFDESAYARTAYEYLHGLRSYENSHPPLGKILVSLGILLFGMTPFGWRFSGVVSAVFLIFMVWKFGEKIFHDSRTSFFAAVLFGFDFYLFTQSRLAQIDTFLVLFITAMYYFMYCYGESILVETSCDTAKRRRTGQRSLLFSGIFFGAAISCKWSGFYAGLGLAFFWLILTVAAYLKKKMTEQEIACLIGWCIVCFILIPVLIYLLSYLPYRVFDPETGYWERVLSNQKDMYAYHSQLKGIHPQSSKWYQWPLAAKPILLFSGASYGYRELVVLLGNPFLWFSGLAAFFYCLYDFLNRKAMTTGVLLLMYLSPMIPWIFISRYTFLYHYFPSLPAMFLMLGYWSENSPEKGKRMQKVLVVCTILLFIIFYPVLSGMPVDEGYSELLEWLPWWKFSQAE